MNGVGVYGMGGTRSEGRDGDDEVLECMTLGIGGDEGVKGVCA